MFIINTPYFICGGQDQEYLYFATSLYRWMVSAFKLNHVKINPKPIYISQDNYNYNEKTNQWLNARLQYLHC